MSELSKRQLTTNARRDAIYKIIMDGGMKLTREFVPLLAAQGISSTTATVNGDLHALGLGNHFSRNWCRKKRPLDMPPPIRIVSPTKNIHPIGPHPLERPWMWLEPSVDSELQIFHYRQCLSCGWQTFQVMDRSCMACGFLN